MPMVVRYCKHVDAALQHADRRRRALIPRQEGSW